MAERTAILVTGSRDWRDWNAIDMRLKLYPKGSILIHGDCGRYEASNDPLTTAPVVIGADKIAARRASLLGFKVWALPYFADLGTRGGPERNRAMFNVLLALREAGFRCFVEAFPIGRSPGTRGMIKIVKHYNDAAAYGDGRMHHPLMPVCVTEGNETGGAHG